MRFRLRRCREAVAACTGCCSPVEQLYSALGLSNPWVAYHSSGHMQHLQYGNTSALQCKQSKGGYSKDSNRQQEQPSSLQRPWQRTAVGEHPGGQLQGAAAVAAAADISRGSSSSKAPWPTASSAGPTSRAAADRSALSRTAGSANSTITRVPGVAAAALASQQHSSSAADAQQAESLSGVESSSSSSGDRSTSSSSSDINSNTSSSDNSGHGVSSSVPSDQVSFQTYALPSHPIDDEEQESLDKAMAVIRKLQSQGYKALIVGGWVRDKYLGRRASDIDISTNATPWELKRLFRDVVELPRSTVKLSYQGEVLELTCFRGISRTASMFSVAMDATRRDFTINALYYDPVTNSVLDFVGGVPDAQQRVLRLTGDSDAPLAEDPLRVLRCVRFVAAFGLRLAPRTAQSVKQHAHLCSVQHGLPARRIWLELRKLRQAEQRQPGTWARALKLGYHLGLLQHIFPWLQHDHKLDSVTLAANMAQQQAVLVAERLAKAWQGRDVPLGLMVAATLPPASTSRQQAHQQLEQYFLNLPNDLDAISTLLHGAGLMYGGSSSSSSGSKGDDGWVQLYASQHAAACLEVLAAWLPDAVAGSFRQLHKARMRQLRDRIVHHKQLLHARQEQKADKRSVPQALLPAASSEAVQHRRRRQGEELAAAIQALVGEQELQQQLEQQQAHASQ